MFGIGILTCSYTGVFAKKPLVLQERGNLEACRLLPMHLINCADIACALALSGGIISFARWTFQQIHERYPWASVARLGPAPSNDPTPDPTPPRLVNRQSLTRSTWFRISVILAQSLLATHSRAMSLSKRAEKSARPPRAKNCTHENLARLCAWQCNLQRH